MQKNGAKVELLTKLIHETPEDYIPNVETGINFYLDGDSRYKISIAFNLCFSEGIPLTSNYNN
jgi:hypothetical protein